MVIPSCCFQSIYVLHELDALETQEMSVSSLVTMEVTAFLYAPKASLLGE